MRNIDKVGDYIVSMGWEYKGSCRCGGMLTYKYEINAEEGEYKIRLRSAHFLISKPGQKFTKLPICEIKNTVDEVVKSHA